jgi:hypothetical protein
MVLDVFEGKFEDDKYIQELSKEEQKEIAMESVNGELGDKFLQALESGSPLDLFDFMAQFHPDDPIRGYLFERAPQGRKTAYKDQWGKKLGEAHQIINETSGSIDLCISNQDEFGFRELWEDETQNVKNAIWGRITQESRNYIQELYK